MRDADQIVVLGDGRILERAGAYAALVARDCDAPAPAAIPSATEGAPAAVP